MTRKEASGLLSASYKSWSEHNAPRLGAALAFYMLLSLAPLLILLVTICGVVMTEATVRQQILVQVRDFAGMQAERTAQMLIDSARQPKSGFVATLVALVTLLSGASGVFLELRDALNTIWDAPKNTSAGIRAIVWQRLISFGMVLALGLLLLVSLILSTAITIAENYFFDRIPANAAFLGQMANFIIPLVATAALFALIFKFVPEVPIAWRDVWVGAFATAILFSIGKALLGFYLGTVGVGSTYGAAGSLVASVVWVYYSAQIFFFGAAFTKGYAVCCGSLSKASHAKADIDPTGAAMVARRQSA